MNKEGVFLAAIISVLSYFLLGFAIPRENFGMLFFLYLLAFLSFYFFLNNSTGTLKELFVYGIIFRIVLLFALPFWSQDFYRFIWDGLVLNQGMSPYEYLPQEIVNSVHFDNAHFLVEKMGELSARHYSNYPPLNQLFFWLSVKVSNGSLYGAVLFMKIIVLLADVGIFYFGKKIMETLNLKKENVLLYFLNPLVIIELSGNLHYEGVMLFFLIWGLYLFLLNRFMYSALLIACSISIKLIPLLLLPFFYQKLKFKNAFFFYLIIIGVNILLFLPFLNNTLCSKYGETISLWFVNFEFNASIYYLLREIGFWIKGYNVIGIIGKITPLMIVITILYLSLYRRNEQTKELLFNALFALSLYFFVSTTVHPWYVINLLVLSFFTNFRYPVVWSLTVVLSYYAYNNAFFEENYYLIFIEYMVVFSFFIKELRDFKKSKVINTAI